MSKIHNVGTVLAFLAAIENNTGADRKIAELLNMTPEDLNTALAVLTVLINANR